MLNIALRPHIATPHTVMAGPDPAIHVQPEPGWQARLHAVATNRWPAMTITTCRLVLRIGEQSFLVHLAVVDRGQFGDEVHHLVLEQGRADLGLGLGIVGIELEHLLLLARELAGAGHDGALHFVAGDRDAVLLAQLAQHQAQAHAALGDLAIFRLQFVLGLALVRGGLALALEFLLDLGPDTVELMLDHGGRQREVMGVVQRIQHPALQMQPAGGLVVGFRAVRAPASFSVARSSRPSFLANSSSILVSSGAFTSLTVTLNTAALPAISAA